MLLWRLTHCPRVGASFIRGGFCRVRTYAKVKGQNSKLDHQARDIVPGDLTATLEAHRRSNRLPFRRIVLEGSADNDVDAQEHEEASARERHTPDETQTEKETVVTDTAGPSTPTTKPRVRRVKPARAENWDEDLLALAPAKYTAEDIKKARRSFKAAIARSRQEARFRENARNSPSAEMLGRSVLGKYVKIIKRPGDHRELYRPWIVPDSAIASDRSTRLSTQLTILCDYLSLTLEEHDFRTDLMLDFTHSLRTTLSDIDFWLFGSHQTGLATPMSDVDVGFYVPSMQKKSGERGPSAGMGRRTNRKRIVSTLDRINISSIWSYRFDEHAVVLARHPLVRMTHIGTSTDVQIVASSPTRLVNEYIRDCLAEYPQLKPIYFVLKAALAARQLDEPRDGGIGSYALLVWIIVGLKRNNISRRSDVAETLAKVLSMTKNIKQRFWGLTTDYPYTFQKRPASERIAISDKGAAKTDPSEWARQRIGITRDGEEYLLCLQDPNDPTNDLGRGVQKWPSIQTTFVTLYHALQKWLAGEQIRSDDDEMTDDLIGFMVGRICNSVQDRRLKFETWKKSFQGKLELEKMRRRLQDVQERDAFQGGGPEKLSTLATGRTLYQAIDEVLGDDLDDD